MEPRFSAVLSRIGNLIGKPQQCWSNMSEGPALPSVLHPYVQAFGLEEQLPRLSVVHVAGSKGKGSTCAMVESILRASGYTTGLFTSPHLCDVRERIRLNGNMVDKETFVNASEWCLDRLEVVGGEGLQKFHPMAACFRIFADAGVDVVILEVGLGGRLDSTNIIPNPVVCAVTSLGYEHTAILGSTLTQIATEKAGIFKSGTPAITISQDPEAFRALEVHAKATGVELCIAPSIEGFASNGVESGGLEFLAGYQVENASLAVAVAQKWEENRASTSASKDCQNRLSNLKLGVLPGEYTKGLRSFHWPGRAQVVQELDNLTFYLDGAHSPESIRACANWYSDLVLRRKQVSLWNVLVFSCGQDKDAGKLLTVLADQLQRRKVEMGYGIFVPFVGTRDGLIQNSVDPHPDTDISMQEMHLRIWKNALHQAPDKSLDRLSRVPKASSLVLHSARASIERVREMAASGRELRVLVTGSLHLVGNVLRLLGRAPL